MRGQYFDSLVDALAPMDVSRPIDTGVVDHHELARRLLDSDIRRLHSLGYRPDQLSPASVFAGNRRERRATAARAAR